MEDHIRSGHLCFARRVMQRQPDRSAWIAPIVQVTSNGSEREKSRVRLLPPSPSLSSRAHQFADFFRRPFLRQPARPARAHHVILSRPSLRSPHHALCRQIPLRRCPYPTRHARALRYPAVHDPPELTDRRRRPEPSGQAQQGRTESILWVEQLQDRGWASHGHLQGQSEQERGKGGGGG